MPRLNYDVAELVLKKLGELKIMTNMFGGVSEETAHALRDNADLWSPSFTFYALPIALQVRIAQESIDRCTGNAEKKLRCNSHIFNTVDLFDYICAPWYTRMCARVEDGLSPPTPRTQSSRSSGGQESLVWSPMVGSSLSGSDDEDLLEQFKTMEAGMDTAK